MILKVFLIALILLALAMLGIGLKSLFTNRSDGKAENHESIDCTGREFDCGCGGGFCAREE
jgi:hypothetical protein